MIFLFLSVLSSTSIFIIFKYLDRSNIETFPVIILNYFFAALLGIIISGTMDVGPVTSDWLFLVLLTGVMFIVMFYIIGLSSKKAGISVTSVASKMSVAIPVVFSILYDPQDSFNLLKLLALLLAIIAVALTVKRKSGFLNDGSAVYLPIILFFGMGIVDSLIKLAQYKYLKSTDPAFYSTILFTVAFITGLLTLLLRKSSVKKIINRKYIFLGMLLGICNFGSIYFLVRTLNYKLNSTQIIDSSIVFGINNLGIVVLSVITGLLIFRERLRLINWIGILTAIAAILLFSYA